MPHDLEYFGLHVPEILLPKNTDALNTWCVNASDQYTSDLAYWQKVDQAVGAAPSTLRMVFPEVYLNTPEQNARVLLAAQAMERYCQEGILAPLAPGCILVRRTLPDGKGVRTGLVVSLDLERYAYQSGMKTLIRVTEGTIPARIPPRLAIREKASLEVPHIMVLLDDPLKTVIEPLWAQADRWEKVYDAPLGFHMGHIAGYFISEEKLDGFTEALSHLYDALPKPKEGDPMLYAMGDGNHSFATAKAHWENIKPTLTLEEQKTHPARFALCELVNLHDDSLLFEAIHRVLFNAPAQAPALLAEAMGATLTPEKQPGLRCIPYVFGKEEGYFAFTDTEELEAALADEGLAKLMAQDQALAVDYVHGSAEARALGAAPHRLALLLSPIAKSDLFCQVARRGALPRKTFSLGEADEKRCYLEARRIVR